MPDLLLPPTLITPKQLAEYLGVHEVTLTLQWHSRGRRSALPSADQCSKRAGEV